MTHQNDPYAYSTMKCGGGAPGLDAGNLILFRSSDIIENILSAQ